MTVGVLNVSYLTKVSLIFYSKKFLIKSCIFCTSFGVFTCLYTLSCLLALYCLYLICLLINRLLITGPLYTFRFFGLFYIVSLYSIIFCVFSSIFRSYFLPTRLNVDYPECTLFLSLLLLSVIISLLPILEE